MASPLVGFDRAVIQRDRLHVPAAVRHAGSGMLTAALSAGRIITLRRPGLAHIDGDAIRVTPLSQQRSSLQIHLVEQPARHAILSDQQSAVSREQGYFLGFVTC